LTTVQLLNARDIVNVGYDMRSQGVSKRDQTIAIDTAYTESSLINNPGGDRDSAGLFQQRPSQGWGTYKQVMDPTYAATQFYNHLLKVPDRTNMDPGQAAQAVQRSAYPDRYTKNWNLANLIFNAVANTHGCTTGAQVGAVGEDGWARPAPGPITALFGSRINPVTHTYEALHAGTDLAAGGCNAPIDAAYPGVIVTVGFDSAGDGQIIIDHGTLDGHNVQTRYLHEWNPSLMASVGQQVVAGQQIGQVGSSGISTGCHLHFGVYIDGQPVDPVPFMQQRGINLNDRS